MHQLKTLHSYRPINFKIRFNNKNGEPEDRCSIVFPFVGNIMQCMHFHHQIHQFERNVVGEVIMNESDPTVPPDFILGEGDEHLIPYDSLTKLSEWNANDPNALLNIVLELLQLYKV
jgi:hypothetical protein